MFVRLSSFHTFHWPPTTAGNVQKPANRPCHTATPPDAPQFPAFAPPRRPSAPPAETRPQPARPAASPALQPRRAVLSPPGQGPPLRHPHQTAKQATCRTNRESDDPHRDDPLPADMLLQRPEPLLLTKTRTVRFGICFSYFCSYVFICFHISVEIANPDPCGPCQLQCKAQ